MSLLVQILRAAFVVDLRSLALARIGLALVVLGDLLVRAEDLGAHYSDAGVLPRAELLTLAWKPWRWSVHAWSGSVEWQGLLFALAALAAMALLGGWRTRWTTVACWLLTVSLQNRNPLVLTGGDTVLRMLLLWAIFMPWGARFSLDWAFGNGSGDSPESKCQTVAHSSLSPGATAWMLQVVMVHVFAGLLKTGAEWRSDLTALHFTLQIDQLRLPTGDLLLALPPNILQALTASILAVELLAPLALLATFAAGRMRLGTVLVLASFHLGLMLTLRLGIFPWINLVSLLPFVPSGVWRRWPIWQSRLERLFAAMASRWPRLGRGRALSVSGPLGSKVVGVVVGLLLTAVLLGNIDSLGWHNTPRVPEVALPVVQALRLEQRWNLFAPYPFKDDGWMVIPGQLAAGRSVDLLRGGRPVSFAKPPRLAEEFPTYRWRKYLRNLWLKRHRAKRPAYAAYLCRQWNAEQWNAGEQWTEERKDRLPAADRLVSLGMIYIEERSVAPGEPLPQMRRVDLWQGPCPGARL